MPMAQLLDTPSVFARDCRQRSACLLLSASCVLLGGVSASAAVAAEQGAPQVQETLIEEVIVTARKREESLQQVPEAVTAYSAATIDAAGIDNVNDFANLTPNLFMREGFRDGVTFITMRGITTAQQGLAPVTVVVDGVQVAAVDFINQGLVDVERIEVLRGPQGALYGSGAMAGAINIVTKAPSNELESRLRAVYAEGNDARLLGVISGPIVSDKLSFRATAVARSFDGITENVRGDEVDYDDSMQLGARLLYAANALQVDARFGYADYESGAIEQARIPVRRVDPVNDSAFLQRHAVADFTGTLFVPVVGVDTAVNDFDNGGFRIESDFMGEEERKFKNAALRISYDFGPATLTSITGYDELSQGLRGDTDWAATDILGIAAAAPSFPSLAPFASVVTGRAQRLTDDFEAYTQELRLTSSDEQRVRWLIGGWYQDRESLTVLSLPVAINTNQLGPDFFGAVGLPFPRTDLKNDKLWAAFGQLNIDLTETLELTLGLRHDEDTYENTAFQCYGCTSTADLLPTTDPQGNAVATLEVRDSKTQPKVSLSYDWTASVMTYVTYAEGFRPGFFANGNLTAPEDTRNFEVGLKGDFFDRSFRLYTAAFHIDYSNQQFSTIIGAPPFRLTTNIPETDIDGLELEIGAGPARGLSLSAGIGLLKAKEVTGAAAPNTPSYTANLSASYSRRLFGSGLEGTARVDYRRQGRYYLLRDERYEVSPRDFLNARLSLGTARWTGTLFVDNVLDERQATEFALIDGTVGFVKSWAGGRQLGIELTVDF